MDEQQGFARVRSALPPFRAGDRPTRPSGSSSVDDTDAAAAMAPVRTRVSRFTFHAACAVTGLFTAVIVGLVFHEVLGEPVGLLLAVSGTSGVLTSLLLYHVAKRRACDRAIVMGGGFVSAVMCSMMFLD